MLPPHLLAETQMLQGMPGSGELMHWPAEAMHHGVLHDGGVCACCCVHVLGKWSDIPRLPLYGRLLHMLPTWAICLKLARSSKHRCCKACHAAAREHAEHVNMY
eukprot:349627-Chlamydomonas_euryale.AAC.1